MAFILERYPEENPFDVDPPPIGLTPIPPDESGDTPEFRAAVCKVARTIGSNPLKGSYGMSPLLLYDYRLRYKEIPIIKYEKPPPLQQITLPERLVFIEQINPEGHTALFKVRVGDQVRLLKLFRDLETSLEGYRKPEEAPPHPMERFERESNAYAHLIHYGATDAGAVPQCYGWLEVSVDDMASIAALPGIDYQWQTLKDDDGPPKALLLEFFENAQELSMETITLSIADRALRALYHVHASYILHHDVRGPNILILPDGRVVWVDFDSSMPVGRSNKYFPVRRQELLSEMGEAWNHFYGQLLPNKRIGFVHWLY